MTINKLAYSLAFLVSLSLAAVANEWDSLHPCAPSSVKPERYVDKDGIVVKYTPEVFKKNLKTYLEKNKEIYAAKHNNLIPTLEKLRNEESFNFHFNSIAVSTAFGGIFMCVRDSFLEGILGGIVVFIAQKMLFSPKDVSSIDDHYYRDAKETTTFFIKEDLYKERYLTSAKKFPLKEGEQVFQGFLDTLTKSSPITE